MVSHVILSEAKDLAVPQARADTAGNRSTTAESFASLRATAKTTGAVYASQNE